MRHIITSIALITLASVSSFQSAACTDSTRCVHAEIKNDSIAADSIHKRRYPGIIGKIVDYFDQANKPRRNKKFDISFIGGPHYSTETQFGIGLVAAGIYRTDSVATPESDVALYLDATTSMFFKFGMRGTNIMPRDRGRLLYDINLASVSDKFWGIGYQAGMTGSNMTHYKYIESEATLSYLWRISPSVFLGPTVAFDYIHARHIRRPELWHYERPEMVNTGIGFTFEYDTRDYLTNAFRGMYLRIDQRINPAFLGNLRKFALTELTYAYYHHAWRDATLALCTHTRLTFGDTPWNLLSTLGGSSTMRGYFEGRFRDKSEADVCLELRQHIWRRNGLAVWVGAGTVFPKFSALRWSHILPNYGIGYRWEFKKRVNVRLDLGFGRRQTGFIFSINEAF